jgi:hypothetical protein
MKTAVTLFTLWAVLLAIPAAHAQGKPVPTLQIEASCEVDLNADQTPDIALVAETSRGFELIVLMRRGRGYSTFVVHKGKQRMGLTCWRGKKMPVPGSKTKTVKTNGAYLVLEKRGKPFVAFYWARRTFQDVWADD